MTFLLGDVAAVWAFVQFFRHPLQLPQVGAGQNVEIVSRSKRSAALNPQSWPLSVG